MDKVVILYCFLWICPVFASNVDILEPDSLAYGKTRECGRDLTLSCKFKNKTFAIAWMNLNDISPIAKCIRNKCDINPKYIDQYKISYDKTNHIFNLTIIKLTMKDHGRQLVCSDGTSADSQLISVKDYEPLLFENTTAGTIQAISGCISNVTKVSFKWIKICAHNKREKDITPKIRNASVTTCSKDNDCGNDQQIQYSEIISAKASDNGNCYLKVVADYGNEQKESYHTVGRYMIDDRDEERSNILIVVAVVLVDFALIITAVACLVYLHHKEKEKDVIQRLGWYDGTEDLTIMAPNLNLDLPKHNEGEVSSEANDMPVNEPTVNNNSVGQAENEEENNLLSKEQTIIDLDTDSDENEEYDSEEYSTVEEYDYIDLDNLDEHVLENDGWVIL